MTKQKNTDNKKLHSKLLGQKKKKKQTQKEANKARIREMNKKANQMVQDEKTQDFKTYSNSQLSIFNSQFSIQLIIKHSQFNIISCF